MNATRVGDFEVQRITEFEGPFIAPEIFFPDFDPEVLRANPDMTGPRLIDPATGKLVFSFHCFVVRTGRHTILIDSCLGNDKERPTRPQFHRLRTPFLADLASAGVEARGRRLRDVHASALGPRRLEHPPRERALGPDLSQRALRHGAPRVRALAGRAPARRGHAAPPRLRGQRAARRADGRSRCWSTTTTPSRTGCGSKAPPATRPATS